MSLQFCTMDHRLPTLLAELGVRKTLSVQAVRLLLFLLEQALSAMQEHNGSGVAFSLNDCVLPRAAGGKNRTRRFCLFNNRNDLI